MRRSDTSIKTERLWLRQIDETDAEAIVALRSDEEVYKYFLNPVKITVDDHRKWYNEQYKNANSRIDWMAVDDYSGDFVGVYGAKKATHDTVEISYITNPKHQGCGYAKEAVEAIIQWCVDNWEADSFEVNIHHNNTDSFQFASHIGFKKDKHINALVYDDNPTHFVKLKRTVNKPATEELEYMVYEYSVTVPMRYNRFDVFSKVPDSEYRFKFDNPIEEEIGIVFRTYELKGHEDGYDFETKVRIKLYNTENEKSQFSNQPDPYITCEIKGMLVDDEKYAVQYAEEITEKICKELSLMINRHNVNKHLFQPRIETDWRKAQWTHKEYQPFVDAKRKALEEIDKDGNRIIHLEDHMRMSESMYMVATSTIHSAEANIIDWVFQKDDVISYLMNEYYSALGSELVKSKFFHLYAIIEFCEREFEDYNGAKRLFDDEDVEDVVGQISVAIGEKNKPNIISRVKQLFTSITDIGRTQKLLNILKHMGIDKYAQYGTDKDINKDVLDEIIKLRNKSFHGASESNDNEYRSAVEKLLYIDEKILEYVIGKKHKAIEPNDYVFITGQRNE